MNVHTIPDGRLCAGDRLSTSRAAQSITVCLTKIIRDAGMSRTTGVSPKSIRLTFAKRILDDAGIVAACRFLGHDSLDSTATALHYEWQAD